MKKRKKLLSLLLVFTLVLAAVIPAFAADDVSPGRYSISIPADKKLIVREEPSSDSKQIDYLYNGETVEVVDSTGGWAMVMQNGKFGWCSAKYAVMQREYECAVLLADISAADCKAVDFEKLAAGGVKGVLLRLGVSAKGASVIAQDSGFNANYDAAKKAGLTVGAYFSSCAVNSAQIIKEYEWVTNKLKSDALLFELPVFYRPSSNAQKALSSAENTLLVSAFCEKLESGGYESGVYLPADWTSKNMNFDELNNYAHWIADFGDYCNFTKSYDIWQYSLNTAFDGVDGKIGLSYMFKDVADEILPPEPSSEKPSESETASEPEPTSEATTEPAPSEEKTTVPPVTEPPVIHREGEFTVTVEPSCTSYGVESAFCLDCGKLLHTRLIPPVGHSDSKWEIVKPSSDNETGIAVRHCDKCGKVSKMRELCSQGSEHIHNFGDWEYVDIFKDGILNRVDIEEGTTAVGEGAESDKKYICTADSEKILRCLDCETVVARYADIPSAHSPSSEKIVTDSDCENDGHEQTVCEICGAVIEDIITPAAGHKVKEWTVIKQPTHTEKGERQGVCSVCGQTVTEITDVLSFEKGDVNADGKVNSSDARTILRAAARLEALDSEKTLRADIDGSGKVNSADARIVLRKAAKLE